MYAHFRTKPAQIRTIAEKLTDRRGAFTVENVYYACNDRDIPCTRLQVKQALDYLTKSGELKYKGDGWFVWLMEG